MRGAASGGWSRRSGAGQAPFCRLPARRDSRGSRAARQIAANHDSAKRSQTRGATLARRALVWALPILLLSVTGCSKVFWRPDLGGAMRLAAEQKQIVVVAYWSALNADCMRMDQEVFSLDEVRDVMRGTIPVRLDPLTDRQTAEQLGLRRVPSFAVLAPDGTILRRAQGYMDDARFRGFIQSAKLSL